jgi:hypothetical protein
VALAVTTSCAKPRPENGRITHPRAPAPNIASTNLENVRVIYGFLRSAELALDFFRIIATAPPSSKETSSISAFMR